MNRPTRTILTVVGVAAFALSGCARVNRGGGDAADDGGSDTSGVGRTVEPTGGTDTVGNQTGNQNGNGSPRPSTSASASAAASGAQIVYFKVTQQPACPVVG